MSRLELGDKHEGRFEPYKSSGKYSAASRQHRDCKGMGNMRTLTAILVVLTANGPSALAEVGSAYYYYFSQFRTYYDDQLCLDVEVEVSAGRRLIVYPCHGEENQLFGVASNFIVSARRLNPSGHGYTLYCLVPEGGRVEEGTHIVVELCNVASTHWTYNPQTLTWFLDGKCMTVSGTLRSLSPVVLSECRSSNAQRWTVDHNF